MAKASLATPGTERCSSMARAAELSPARRWIDQRQAAEYLGITDRTLRRMIAAGDLPAYRLGPRLLRIDVGDLDALMRPVPVGGGSRG